MEDTTETINKISDEELELTRTTIRKRQMLKQTLLDEKEGLEKRLAVLENYLKEFD